jgi:hypothetical protein
MVIWGGFGTSYLGTGGRYNPATDVWSPTSTTGAPSGRYLHTAVWAGGVMVVWGGQDASSVVDTGGRYDPGADTWTATSTTGAPSARYYHKAIWTGSLMVVWGGQDASSVLGTGGRYALGQSVDNDHDGFSECTGDCDDTQASVYPGAPQICDGMNNDCNQINWPGLAGTNERDDDGDTLSECQGDCDDGDASIWGTPGEVTGLFLTPTGSQTSSAVLDWTAPATGGTISSLRYDTLRSASPADFVTGTFCVETNDGPNTTATDSTPPFLGGVFFYLVRAENSCPAGQGPLGTDSAGVPRSGRSCP